MFILTHVTIALLSLVFTAVTFIRPSQQKLRIASLLVGATIATGTFLVIQTHSSMLSVCLIGLFYIGGSLGALLAVKQRLAHQRATNKMN